MKRSATVDPVNGQPSIAANAITHSAFNLLQKVDPQTGKPSTAANAILSSTFKDLQKVDPETGQTSTAANAISLTTFRHRKKKIPKSDNKVHRPKASAVEKWILKQASRVQQRMLFNMTLIGIVAKLIHTLVKPVMR